MAKAKHQPALSALIARFFETEAHACHAQEEVDQYRARCEVTSVELHKLAQRWDEMEAARAATLTMIVDYPAATAADLLAKLQLADRFEDFMEEANEPGQKLVACRVIASAIRDAERLAKKEGAA